MKKLNGILALLLCLLFLVPALASCGKKTPDVTTAEPTTAGGEQGSSTSASSATEATTTSKWETIGNAVSAYAATDRTLRIQYDMYVSSENIPQNDKYIQGPDSIIDGGTSLIEEKVYNRNRAAAELLGLTLEYSSWDDLGWSKQAGRINQLVGAVTADAPDLFIDMLYDLNVAMKTSGSFKDIKSIPGSFFDFAAKGWMTDWMESLSFTGDRAYILGGDYFLELFRAMGVLPFNIDLMDANASKLAPAFLPIDEPLDANEDLSVVFFDIVEQGDWTWDGLGKLCAAMWVDTDGDGANSFEDTLGIVTDRYTGLPASLIVYSSGVQLTETYVIEDEADANNGKTWVKYKDDSTILGSVFDAVSGVFSGSGAFVTNFNPDSGKNLKEHYAKFASDTLLFAGPIVLGALEEESFQTMGSIWSVVPIPKIKAEQEYNTMIHNIADVGAINVNTSADKARTLSAFLQFCNENSGDIREEFQQVVTKFKTTTYNQGTDRMLDIIYKHVISGRDKALEDTAEGTSGKTSASWMKKEGMAYTGTSADVASLYQSNLSSKQAKLDSILTKWYELPVTPSETPAE